MTTVLTEQTLATVDRNMSEGCAHLLILKKDLGDMAPTAQPHGHQGVTKTRSTAGGSMNQVMEAYQ